MNRNFEDFMNNLKKTNRTYNYYVNWNKAIDNSRRIEVSLNILNSLLGKDNLKKEFRDIFKEYPETLKVIPILLAIREEKFDNCIIEGGNIFNDTIDFTNYREENFEKYYNFIVGTGLIYIFKDLNIKNLVDYVLGIEVGLDSNGRKNRSGHIMEDLVEVYVKKYCYENNIKYLKEANAKKVKEEFNIDIEVDKSSRRFDFVIKKENKLYMFEVNFYNSAGSKLKATAGEYKTLDKFLIEQGHELIWVTDGQGWSTAKLPLEEAYNINKNIINLQDLSDGILDSIMK